MVWKLSRLKDIFLSSLPVLLRSSSFRSQRVLSLDEARQVHKRPIRVVPLLRTLRLVRLDNISAIVARLKQMDQSLKEAEIVALEHAVQFDALLDRVLLVVLLDRDVPAANCHHYPPVRHLLHLLDLGSEQVRILVDLDDWHKGGQDRHQVLQLHLLALLYAKL